MLNVLQTIGEQLFTCLRALFRLCQADIILSILSLLWMGSVMTSLIEGCQAITSL